MLVYQRVVHTVCIGNPVISWIICPITYCHKPHLPYVQANLDRLSCF